MSFSDITDGHLENKISRDEKKKTKRPQKLIKQEEYENCKLYCC